MEKSYIKVAVGAMVRANQVIAVLSHRQAGNKAENFQSAFQKQVILESVYAAQSML
jgi:regulator of extracellular matrix RemA (YlzA/DUF370 family)